MHTDPARINLRTPVMETPVFFIPAFTATLKEMYAGFERWAKEEGATLDGLPILGYHAETGTLYSSVYATKETGERIRAIASEPIKPAAARL